jgi:hypothetical protein
MVGPGVPWASPGVRREARHGDARTAKNDTTLSLSTPRPRGGSVGPSTTGGNLPEWERRTTLAPAAGPDPPSLAVARHRPIRSALALLLAGALSLAGWYGSVHLAEHLAAPAASLVDAPDPGRGTAAHGGPCLACVHPLPDLPPAPGTATLRPGPAVATVLPVSDQPDASALPLPARGPRGPPHA